MTFISENSKSLGKVLHQLLKLGVPMHIVSVTTLAKPNLLHYKDKPLATWIMNEQDFPVFTFSELHSNLQSLKQIDIYSIYTKDPSDLEEKLISNYTVIPPAVLSKLDKDYNENKIRYRIFKHNVPKNGLSSIEEKVSRLKLAIG